MQFYHTRPLAQEARANFGNLIFCSQGRGLLFAVRTLDILVKELNRMLHRRPKAVRDVVIVALVGVQFDGLPKFQHPRVQIRRKFDRHRFICRAVVKLNRPRQIAQVGRRVNGRPERWVILERATVLPRGPHCGCGNRGCLEALASGTAIAREGRELVVRGMPTVITELAEGDPDRVSAKLVAQATEQGDIQAQEIIADAMTYLGVGMASLVNLFNPELIVIGGGLTNMGEGLFGPVRRIIDRRALYASAEVVKVVPAQLSHDVGILGAAAVALREVGLV